LGLAYRLVQETDLPGVQTLWKEEAKWGSLGEELWRRYVIDAPFGAISGTVATDTESGRIVGQFAFIPSLVSLNGRVVRAFRPGAPIVARGLRFRSANPLNHPVVAMYKFAIKALRERGDGLIYMVPDSRWVRLFRMFPFLQTGSLPLCACRSRWPLPCHSEKVSRQSCLRRGRTGRQSLGVMAEITRLNGRAGF